MKQYLNNLIEESHSLFTRIKGNVRTAGLVALIGSIIGVGVYGCKKKEPVSPPVAVQDVNQPDKSTEQLEQKIKSYKDRVESARKLQDLSKALLIYANDHGEKYPESLEELKPYVRHEQDLQWIIKNVDYLGKGKDITISPQTVIAYDKTLLEKGTGTNVLFNDSHVTFEKTIRLKDLSSRIEITKDKTSTEADLETNKAETFTFRIINPDGTPSTDVHVYKWFSFRDGQKSSGQFKSDDNGIVTLREEDIFKYKYERRGVLLYALSDSNKLAGFLEVQGDMVGHKLGLQLQPVCTVYGCLESSSLEKLGQNLKWTNVYLFKDRHRPLSYSSKEHKFEFLLPPGRYKLHGYGTNTYSCDREIEIKTGQQELEVNLDLPADKLATLVGKPAPEFRSIKGWMNTSPISLEELRGKVVILDFWGYWCGPCVGSMPKLMELHDKYNERGLVIIGIHDDSMESIEKLEEKLGDIRENRWDGRDIQFAVALDGGGRTEIEGTERSAQGATTAAYGIQGWPTYVLIDKEGKVVKKVHMSSPELTEQLEQMLGANPP